MVDGTPVVYVFFTEGGRLFKIGFSGNPPARSRGLNEAIDWYRSYFLEFPKHFSARSIESDLHRFLRNHQAPTGNRRNGYTEWYHESSAALLQDYIEGEATSRFVLSKPRFFFCFATTVAGWRKQIKDTQTLSDLSREMATAFGGEIDKFLSTLIDKSTGPTESELFKAKRMLTTSQSHLSPFEDA